MEHITLEEYKQLQQKGNSKYKNKKMIIDNIEFDSHKEGFRYIDLRLLERQGLIKDLRRQVGFELQPSYKKNGKTIKAIYYIADFVYIESKTGKVIVEDVKSEATKTQVYRLKKKIFEYKYPELEIKEV